MTAYSYKIFKSITIQQTEVTSSGHFDHLGQLEVFTNFPKFKHIFWTFSEIVEMLWVHSACGCLEISKKKTHFLHDD